MREIKIKSICKFAQQLRGWRVALPTNFNINLMPSKYERANLLPDTYAHVRMR